MKELILFFLLMCPSVFAFGLRTAGELKTSCRTNVAVLNGAEMHRADDAMDIGICTGFIEGWWECDFCSRQKPFPNEESLPSGNQKGVGIGEICKVFLKYMDQHPEKENEAAGLALMDALFDAKLARYTEVPNE